MSTFLYHCLCRHTHTNVTATSAPHADKHVELCYTSLPLCDRCHHRAIFGEHNMKPEEIENVMDQQHGLHHQVHQVAQAVDDSNFERQLTHVEAIAQACAASGLSMQDFVHAMNSMDVLSVLKKNPMTIEFDARGAMLDPIALDALGRSLSATMRRPAAVTPLPTRRAMCLTGEIT